jgi:hypothetical protein
MAKAFLDHTRDELPKCSALRSARYMHHRDILDAHAGKSPFHVVLSLHHDSFSPFKTRQNEFSVAYMLIQVSSALYPGTGTLSYMMSCF